MLEGKCIYCVFAQVGVVVIAFAVQRADAHPPAAVPVPTQGLHDTPVKLTRMVQEQIDRLEQYLDQRMVKHPPQAIVLGYGLCSNGVAGLKARGIPLVVPRTDDCIAIFLGSQRRYLEAFHRYPGTYWINNGWLEHGFVPTREALEERYARYVQDYGEDNAQFLMEQDGQWQKHYTTAG